MQLCKLLWTRALDPEDETAIQEYRKVISPYKGVVYLEDSSDEEAIQNKKPKRKGILENARAVKKWNEEAKRDFTLAKQAEFEGIAP